MFGTSCFVSTSVCSACQIVPRKQLIFGLFVFSDSDSRGVERTGNASAQLTGHNMYHPQQPTPPPLFFLLSPPLALTTFLVSSSPASLSSSLLGQVICVSVDFFHSSRSQDSRFGSQILFKQFKRAFLPLVHCCCCSLSSRSQSTQVYLLSTVCERF